MALFTISVLCMPYGRQTEKVPRKHIIIAPLDSWRGVFFLLDFEFALEILIGVDAVRFIGA